MNLRTIKLSDLQLNGCGVFTLPNGSQILELPWTVPVFTSVAALTTVEDFEVSTHPEFAFEVKAVSYTGLVPGTLIQIQWPDGLYLQNTPVDFFSFCGTGKRARWLEVPKLCGTNAKIRLNINNSAVDQQSDIELYFEGVLKIPMVNG